MKGSMMAELGRPDCISLQGRKQQDVIEYMAALLTHVGMLMRQWPLMTTGFVRRPEWEE